MWLHNLYKKTAAYTAAVFGGDVPRLFCIKCDRLRNLRTTNPVPQAHLPSPALLRGIVVDHVSDRQEVLAERFVV